MANESDVCFVVMPFGIKSLADGSDRNYDFDKVYRVIIQRAIREAGMKPHRADEGIGSSLIHTDMFRDLRDRPVVLADLSLENPNVFYELGIRHVMADSGTVLICREGASLPFDVGLSRVVFYKYDGTSLDWEEVERATPIVAAALQEARRGKPDSPVHALLPGTVLRAVVKAQQNQQAAVGAAESDELEKYEHMVATSWLPSGMDLGKLYKEHRGTVFGTRALGVLCLESKKIPAIAATVAGRLSDQEQYRLANRIFERLLESDKAGWQDILRYATSYSEAQPTLSAADQAIVFAKQALDTVKTEFPTVQLQTDVKALFAYGECIWRISSLQRWRYQLTADIGDLENAIQTCQESLAYMRKARVLGGFPKPGRLAQVTSYACCF